MKLSVFGILGLAIVSAIVGIILVYSTGLGLSLENFTAVYKSFIQSNDYTFYIMMAGSVLIAILWVISLILIIVKRKPIFVIGLVLSSIASGLFEFGAISMFYDSTIGMQYTLCLVGNYLAFYVCGALALIGTAIMAVGLISMKKIVKEQNHEVEEEIKPVEETKPVEEIKQEPVEEEKPIEEEPIAKEKEVEKVEKPIEKKAPAKKEPVANKKAPVKKDVDNSKANDNGAIVYHISQRKELNKWQVKRNQSQKAVKLFDTQKDAIDYAKDLAKNQNASIRIHSKEGKIRKE
jgi:outer membrane biosynthesis protein TonB